MTNERPVCVYAIASLKRNSTRLMVVMCVGIVLALYGVYVQARSQSNPNYMPTIVVASNWFYEHLGHRFAKPSSLLGGGCPNGASNVFKPTVGQLIMYRFIYPTMRYSGLINGLINVIQIVFLRVYCKSFTGTDAIIGLSAVGLVVSMVCLVGSFAICKLMCISCLGVQHAAIIYLAMRRRRILKNILCPTENINPGACTFGSDNNKSSSSAPNAITAQQSSPKHSGACTTRRRNNDNNNNNNNNNNSSSNNNNIRRRSDRV